MSFNLNLPLGPWFIAVVIIVALFMAVICTTILYVCCKGCSGRPISSMEDLGPSELSMRDKPPSYRRFLRSLSNLRLYTANTNSANRAADTGTPPPKYDDVISGKFTFSTKEIQDYSTEARIASANQGIAQSNAESQLRVERTLPSPPSYSELPVVQETTTRETRIPMQNEDSVAGCSSAYVNPSCEASESAS